MTILIIWGSTSFSHTQLDTEIVGTLLLGLTKKAHLWRKTIIWRNKKKHFFDETKKNTFLTKQKKTLFWRKTLFDEKTLFWRKNTFLAKKLFSEKQVYSYVGIFRQTYRSSNFDEQIWRKIPKNITICILVFRQKSVFRQKKCLLSKKCFSTLRNIFFWYFSINHECDQRVGYRNIKNCLI